MQLYFVRHGQSVNNALWAQTGASQGRKQDPELTELGQEQALRVGALLAQPLSQPAPLWDSHNRAGFGLTHLYCSLMARAIQTALAIASATGLPLSAWETIHEEGGLYLDDSETGEPVGQPGMGRSEFAAQFPALQLPLNLGESGWWSRPFEAFSDRPRRARRFLRELLERHGGSDDRVAIVSHGGFYNRFLHALLKLPEDTAWFAMSNTAVTRVDFDKNGEITLVYQNRVDHLPPELIT